MTKTCQPNDFPIFIIFVYFCLQHPCNFGEFFKTEFNGTALARVQGSIFYPNMWKWKQWILKQILHEHSTYSFLFLATNNPLHKRSFNTNIMNLLRLKQFSLPSHTTLKVYWYYCRHFSVAVSFSKISFRNSGYYHNIMNTFNVWNSNNTDFVEQLK